MKRLLPRPIAGILPGRSFPVLLLSLLICLPVIAAAGGVVEDFETGDLSRLPWTTGGIGPWGVTGTLPHNGLFSATAPNIREGNSSWMEAEVFCDQGAVSFWYRVQTEPDSNDLRFYVDNELKGAWSGARNYTTTAVGNPYTVAAGWHTFRWEYRKDVEGAGAEDAVWVDDIVLPAADPDADSDGDNVPDGTDAFPGDITEWADSDGDGIGDNADPDDDNDGMPDTFETASGLDPLDPADAMGDLDGDGATNRSEFRNGTGVLDPTEGVAEDFETGDLSRLPWATRGDGAWAVSGALPHLGSFSAASPAMTDNQSASLETEIYCTEGEVSFWYEVDSEQHFDHLMFYIDDQLRGAWSGAVPYTTSAAADPYTVATGWHTFRWAYVKDLSVSVGQDAAWIDDIVIPAALPDHDSDGDNVPDLLDAFPFDINEWIDSDGDGIGDNADPDDDNDGLPDLWEDGNGLDSLDPADAGLDADGDGASNRTEFENGTNPQDPAEGVTEDFETGDLTRLPWVTGGSASWAVTGDMPRGGVRSCASPALSHDQSAWLEAEVFCREGEVSFWYTLDTEANFDHLLFYVDDVLRGAWSGAVPYTTTAVADPYTVAAGWHTFRWEYAKDVSLSLGQDTVWIDDIVLPVAATGGDVDRSGRVDLADAIRCLQVLADLPGVVVHKEADVTGDTRIGLGEATFILWTLSE